MQETIAVRTQDMIRQMARKYARAFRIEADEEDLIQVGLMSAAIAARGWRPNKGASLSTLQYMAARWEILKAARKSASPVSSGHHALAREIPQRAPVTMSALLSARVENVDAEHREQTRRARERLVELLEQSVLGDVVAEHLLLDTSIRQIAARDKLSQRKIRDAVQTVVAKLREDETLRALWETV